MTAQQKMIRVYDRTMRGRYQKRYYEDSGFFNFGYWHPPTSSQRQASEALVNRLLEKIPNKVGRILDVACGLGASTRLLMDWYPPEMITGINISEAQLAEARRRAPGCAFLRMDATRLEFSDAEFDAVICVEAAFHFDTRDAFLGETLRILKPGGSLVLSDILLRDFVALLAEHSQVPRANFVTDIAAYRKRLENAGFHAVDVQDATDICLGEFRRNLVRWPAAEHRRGHMSFRTSIAASIACHLISGYFATTCKTYLLASARKPA
jgi:MPBQ/MSBQ methyltransferase